ncbi:N/A [soil metagenome]
MRVVVIGAAGQARELRWYLAAAGHECVGFVVSDRTKLGSIDSVDLVLGEEAWLEDHRDAYDAAAIAIATPTPRLRVARRLRERIPSLPWPAIVHPTAHFDPTSVKIADGVMIGAGAVVTVNVELAEFARVNFGATVGHDTVIGRGSVINPGANVSGGVRIGEGVLIGAGAVILQYLSIGDGATVGAGAVVTRDVAPGATVVGVPARSRAGSP